MFKNKHIDNLPTFGNIAKIIKKRLLVFRMRNINVR
jgi:hypothetical protein